MKRRASAALLLVAWCSGCVQFGVSRYRTNPPIDDAALAPIEPGRSGLQDCLDRLGAPQLVLESLDGDLVIAYGWADELSWGLEVSYPLGDFFDARLSWDQVDRNVPGVILIFDRDYRLLYVERGFLADLVAASGDGDPALRALADTP